LLVGDSVEIAGMAPNATLFAAEAFFRVPEIGLVSTSFKLVSALEWLAQNDVQVINMSLTGPHNEVLRKAVEMVSNDHIVIVAAAGNDGPAAGPRYPAAYANVLAVTAVDENARPFLRAVRGPHLDFAAPGVRLRVADASEPSTYRLATGTSFATPFITALVMHYQGTHPETGRFMLIKAMQADVIDLGVAGHDEIFGWGLAGSSLLADQKKQEQ